MKYPEHDKLQAVKEQSETIGAFLEWLGRSHLIHVWQEAGDNGEPRVVPATDEDLLRIADSWGLRSRQYQEAQERGVPNPDYHAWGAGCIPDYTSINARLAAYFNIDLEKLDAEKRAMLEVLRTA